MHTQRMKAIPDFGHSGANPYLHRYPVRVIPCVFLQMYSLRRTAVLPRLLGWTPGLRRQKSMAPLSGRLAHVRSISQSSRFAINASKSPVLGGHGASMLSFVALAAVATSVATTSPIEMTEEK